MRAITTARVVAVAVVVASMSACSSDDTNNNTGTGTNQVQATANLAFSPAAITVATGSTVTWVFGSVGHNVTFTAATGVPSDIGGANANTSISRTFATAGVYAYHCTIHPSMTGTVTVAASTSASY